MTLSEKELPKRRSKPSNKALKIKKQRRWTIFITIWTFFLSIGINLVTELFIHNTKILFSLGILITIIAIGIFFDMVGIAVASASMPPFNAMAANRVKGSKEAVGIVKNASQVSNFCNDVIGDICGIVSGATAISIIYQIGMIYNLRDTTILVIVINGFVAALTVGGKALGKNVAMEKNTRIVYQFGLVMAFVKNPLAFRKGDKGSV
jgi:hypothetical protein